jgi:GH24 family phage-related lysozyme (muramidase)
MTNASLRTAAQHIARVGAITPHQLAALTRLEEMLSDQQRQQFTELWRAEGSPAAKVPAAAADWLAPALKIIKEFEGCHLDAYLCPTGVPTIGWGATRLNDRLVQLGDKISQARADQLLTDDVRARHQRLMELLLMERLPMAQQWPGNRVAALVSWAYNVGMQAVADSTLRRRLLAGEDPVQVVSEELPKWDKANGKPLAGLTRRRAAEVALFVGRELQQGHGNPLQVPWYAQMDSADRAQAARMCFSSSCAMLLQYLKPGTLTGPNGDDQYLQRVQTYGDTTDAKAQIRALSSFGVRAKFTQAAGWGDIERQIAKGVPVPCGFLHRGPVSAPGGGGHWLIVVGFTQTHLIVHDPFGEADLVNGTTLGGVARFARYSRQNFGPRWMAEGPGSGWAILAER